MGDVGDGVGRLQFDGGAALESFLYRAGIAGPRRVRRRAPVSLAFLRR